MSLTIGLTGIVLMRPVEGAKAVAGANVGNVLVSEGELQADDQRVDIGRGALHDTNRLKFIQEVLSRSQL